MLGLVETLYHPIDSKYMEQHVAIYLNGDLNQNCMETKVAVLNLVPMVLLTMVLIPIHRILHRILTFTVTSIALKILMQEL